MGLDWMLNRRPGKGTAQEITALMVVPENESEEARLLRVRRVDELQWDNTSPFAIMGCPVIGVDEVATQFLRKDFDERREWYAKTFDVPADELWDAVLKRKTGQYVPDLAKEPEGLGAIVGIAAPIFSYRGKAVAGLEFLPPEVADRAFEDMTSEQMLEYADTLTKWAEEAIKQAVDPTEAEWMRITLADEAMDLSEPEDLPPNVKAVRYDFWVVRTACTWLRYWGSRGFSMWAWS